MQPQKYFSPVSSAKYFRDLNYNFKKNLSEKNKEIVLDKLNTIFGTDFRKQDIWGTTTVYNKFTYFRRHLVDCEILEKENQSIKINEKNRKETIKAISID